MFNFLIGGIYTNYVSNPNNYYVMASGLDYGSLVLAGGANAGFATEVKRHGSEGGRAVFQLWQAPAATIRPGDGFSVMPGCDKSFATCRAKFGNGASFRGFPHMPTADFIIGGVRPGDGALDGGSLFR